MEKQLSILLVISLLAVGIGTSFVWMHNHNSENNTNTNTRVNTLGEWQTCRNQSKFKICDQIIGNQKELNNCYQAATDFANTCYPNHSNTTQECANFWQFYESQQQDAVLPQDYFTCTNQGLAAAQQSNFFLKNNYQILWVNCATTQE